MSRLDEYKKKCMRNSEFRAEYERVRKRQGNIEDIERAYVLGKECGVYCSEHLSDLDEDTNAIREEYVLAYGLQLHDGPTPDFMMRINEEGNRIVDPDMLDAWKLGFDEGYEDAQAG